MARTMDRPRRPSVIGAVGGQPAERLEDRRQRGGGDVLAGVAHGQRGLGGDGDLGPAVRLVVHDRVGDEIADEPLQHQMRSAGANPVADSSTATSNNSAQSMQSTPHSTAHYFQSLKWNSQKTGPVANAAWWPQRFRKSASQRNYPRKSSPPPRARFPALRLDCPSFRGVRSLREVLVAARGVSQRGGASRCGSRSTAKDQETGRDRIRSSRLPVRREAQILSKRRRRAGGR